MEIFSALTAYHWLVFGLILLGAEALGAAGFLLGAGIAALATGLVVWFAPELSTGLQMVIFAIGAVLATYLYFQAFRQVQADADVPPINQRAASLVGHRFALDQPLSNGAARVQIGDTMWKVSCEGPIEMGSEVVVVSAENMSLRLALVE